MGVFIDLKKAFDTINHNLLLKKLAHYGIRGVANNWLASYLSNRKQYVSIDECNSDLLNVLCGVPQGSILGQKLFILYVNDICNISKMKEVNVYKAIGPDLIPNRILKDCCVELAPILTQIYKKSLQEGRLPQEWLSANVTAIFKKGARHEASNYRPISLTSVTCKIFEHVLFSQMMRHYTRHKFINPLQHGFQKGLSCETQLATTVDQLQKRLDDKQQVDLIILDFQKAFDKVPHRHLLHKLHESGIHGQLHEWLTCYLTERTQRVIVDGCESTEARVMSGVPQGTVLGPLLFLTYINDIANGINGQMRLFADDALLYYPVRTIADGASLQHDLHTLHRWSKSWKMAFNGKKCHVMHVTRNINITNCSTHSDTTNLHQYHTTPT